MIDNPKPDLETVRGIVEQIAKGLRAFHRKEMLHQDLRPDNIMIDKTGTVKIIDFGATKIAGVAEAAPAIDATTSWARCNTPRRNIFAGKAGSPRSDLFSLGVIAYQMLTGRLPYGAQIAQARTKSQLGKLRYDSALGDSREIPVMDRRCAAKGRASRPAKRYESLSEFIFDLRHPNAKYLERNADAADRAQSDAVLEMRDGLAGLRWWSRCLRCYSNADGRS